MDYLKNCFHNGINLLDTITITFIKEEIASNLEIFKNSIITLYNYQLKEENQKRRKIK